MANTLEQILSYANLFGIDSWKELIETILLIVGAIATGFVISEVLVFLGEIRIKLSPEYKNFIETIEGRLPLIGAFGERQMKLTKDIETIDQEIEQLSKRQSGLMSQLRQIRELQSRAVRTIGQPTEGMKCYRALISNTYVADFVGQGKRHPLYDDRWARPQIVEVWTTSSAICQFVLREKYPKGQGFIVDKVEPVQSGVN